MIGDSDLYGIGVRRSFYLQFGAGLVAMLGGPQLSEELKNVRRGIIIVSSAVLIKKIVGTVRRRFAVLQWYIVKLLTIGLAVPCFFWARSRWSRGQMAIEHNDEEEFHSFWHAGHSRGMMHVWLFLPRHSILGRPIWFAE